ncbi:MULTISPECIES: Pr6Pr family membrane protein [unclassified Microbacterium]|uniref:Pr6Pr family membrane protein n=1 Tax=unclassified Microbacterium TaxID=2609290 RepID=UPI00301641A1
MTTWWPFLRIAAALLGAAALIRQLAQSIGNAQAATTEWGSHLPTVITNFFSYFTVLSNIGAVVTFTIGAVWMLRTRGRTDLEPRWLATLFACVSTYMIVTGIVYNLLLRNIPLDGVSEVWTNETLHVIIPLAMLLDVLFAPRRRALPWSAVAVAAVFPIVWAVYTLTRANFITAPLSGTPYWYPYPFLNPHTVPGGYLGVAAYIVGIAIAIIGVAALVVWIGRRRATPRPS